MSSENHDSDTFDLDAWLRGIAPNRRSVTIHGRPDLADEMRELRHKIAEADGQGDKVDRGISDPGPEALRAQMELLGQEYEASRATFVVEGRSTDRRNRMKTTLKEQGITDPIQVSLHLLVDAIVSPPGVTVAMLNQMAETLEPQLNLIALAANEVNAGVPRVDVPFSSASSKDRGRATS